MDPEPLRDEVRDYLRKHFGVVTEDSAKGDFYIFYLTASEIQRQLRVHRKFFTIAGGALSHLEKLDIAGRLKRDNLQIAPVTPNGRDFHAFRW